MSYETFDPVANGWHLQRNYEIPVLFAVEEDERELGNRTSTAISEKSLRQFRAYYRAKTRAAQEYVRSFFQRHVGPAGRFYFQWPEYVASPDKVPTLEAISGGSQAERTITVRYAWKNTNGTTNASPIGSLLVPVNNLIKVTVPVYPPSIAQCLIYASQTGSGTEEEQATLTGPKTWTQPDAALLTGTADPPSANTALETPLCKLYGGYSLVRREGTTYNLSLTLEEVYSA